MRSVPATISSVRTAPSRAGSMPSTFNGVTAPSARSAAVPRTRGTASATPATVPTTVASAGSTPCCPAAVTSRRALPPSAANMVRAASRAVSAETQVATRAATPRRTPSTVSSDRPRRRTSSRRAQRQVVTVPLDRLYAPVRTFLRADGAIRDEPSVDHPHEAVGAGRIAGIVRHHHDRELALVAEPAEQGHDLRAGAAVEIAGGLVGEQEHGTRRERARDGDPLLLAPRQLGGNVLHPRREPHLGESGPRSFLRLAVGPAVDAEGQGDVFDGRENRHQVEGLEDESETATT